MILINESPFPAALARTVLSEQVMLATVVTKATYVTLDDGRVELANAQQPVLREPTKLGGVAFPADLGYGKLGVDVLALGSAFAPGGRPVHALMAGVSIAQRDLTVAVIGDRWWRRTWRGYAPSDPQPFVEMPLGWDRAYGGYAKVRGGELPNLDNLLGTGYVLDEAAAEGVKLPNVEDPAQLIRELGDRPRPVSFCPLPVGTSYTADALEGVDERGGGLTREIYNVAIPAHRLPDYPAGASVRLHNLTSGPRPEFRLPAHGVVAEVAIGSARYEFFGEVDTLLLMPAEHTLALTHRVVFRYDYARGLPRAVRLRSTQLQGQAALAWGVA